MLFKYKEKFLAKKKRVTMSLLIEIIIYIT
jgi:hypothetical protein